MKGIKEKEIFYNTFIFIYLCKFRNKEGLFKTIIKTQLID